MYIYKCLNNCLRVLEHTQAVPSNTALGVDVTTEGWDMSFCTLQFNTKVDFSSDAGGGSFQVTDSSGDILIPKTDLRVSEGPMCVEDTPGYDDPDGWACAPYKATEWCGSCGTGPEWDPAWGNLNPEVLNNCCVSCGCIVISTVATINLPKLLCVNGDHETVRGCHFHQ